MVITFLLHLATHQKTMTADKDKETSEEKSSLCKGNEPVGGESTAVNAAVNVTGVNTNVALLVNHQVPIVLLQEVEVASQCISKRF